MGRDQDCCSTFYHTQGSSPKQTMICPKLSVLPRPRNPAPGSKTRHGTDRKRSDQENVLTRTTKLTQVKSKVLEWRQCGREMTGLSKRVGNLAVPPLSTDPSLVIPRPNAGGVNSTASAPGSLHLLKIKQKCKGDQQSWGGNGDIGCPAW